jgi:hypothetical protein
VATFFHNVINSTPADLAIGRLLIEENLLPENTLASIYRTMHQRLSDFASAVFGTSAYENGYYTGTEYFYPARELADWRKRFLDYLIRTRSYEQARLLIATIKREQDDLELATESDEEGGSTSEDRYDWLPLASALIELRGARDAAKAITELRRYCGLEWEVRGQKSETGEDETDHQHMRCLKAYALLIAEHREKDADALLYDAYSKLVRSRYADDASLAGLAEIEARRGRSEEASRLLKLLVERSTDNLKALQLAAETAARSTRYSDAIDFREQIARSRPGDAVDQLVTLITDRATANSVRAQAAEVLGEMVSRDRSLASRATALLDQRERGAAASIVRAAISEAAGNREEARTALASVTSGPLAAVAQMRLGQLTLVMGRDAEAVASFERAIYLDADGIITDAIAFRTPGPRAQLIKLYGKIGRDLAAVRLADAEQQNAQSSISAAITAAIRRAVSPGFAREGAQATVSFEPSLEITRSRTMGLTTLAEMKDSTASSVRDELLASLVESAAKLGQYDRATAIERLRAAEATKAEEKAAIEKRLAEIAAAERARQLRLALMTRINRSNATESVYAARVLGKE